VKKARAYHVNIFALVGIVLPDGHLSREENGQLAWNVSLSDVDVLLLVEG